MLLITGKDQQTWRQVNRDYTSWKQRGNKDEKPKSTSDTLGTLSNDLVSTEGVLEREETEKRQKKYLKR